ncbi:MAG TPA: undecaprenyl-diphosphate phosphatase [Myxococcaceae bacterium]|jgi:undecaprenyl-diphosphatase|nr:undecaprenyl-diphosphate phosphatase [Myxococcaceae bacterium]
MSLLEAVVLGVVQGLTEFLPISSTAHLRIAPALLGWPDPGAAYSAVIQLGTVGAVLLYFWRDIVRIVTALARGIAARNPWESPDARLGWLVAIGTVPIGVAGLAFKDAIETSFRSLYVISGMLIALAILLFLAERLASHRRTMEQMTVKDGLVIGLWQAVALVPGSSRSGTTLTGGLFLGLRREDAARFSFLLSIPATTLAGVFELRHLLQAADRPSNVVLAVGTVVSFVSGVAAIAGLLRFLRTRTTLVFVVYRIALGVLLIALVSTGRLEPDTGAEVQPRLHSPAP